MLVNFTWPLNSYLNSIAQGGGEGGGGVAGGGGREGEGDYQAFSGPKIEIEENSHRQ